MQLGKWLREMDKNPLVTLGKAYTKCRPCEEKVSLPHSDFSHLKDVENVGKVKGSEFDEVYKRMREAEKAGPGAQAQ